MIRKPKLQHRLPVMTAQYRIGPCAILANTEKPYKAVGNFERMKKLRPEDVLNRIQEYIELQNHKLTQ